MADQNGNAMQVDNPPPRPQHKIMVRPAPLPTDKGTTGSILQLVVLTSTRELSGYSRSILQFHFSSRSRHWFSASSLYTPVGKHLSLHSMPIGWPSTPM